MEGIEAGDINGDGFTDVIGASYNNQRYAVWLGGTAMDGHAELIKFNQYENFGYDLAMGDFNGDGYYDVAVSAPFEEGTWPYHDYRGYVFVYAGNPGMVANDDPTAPQLSDQIQMRLSPNPVQSNGEINISLTGFVKDRGTPLIVEVFNLKGQVIHQSEVKSITSAELISTVNLANYPSGVYICRARIGNRSTSKKFTIIK